jgi:predicted transcriptional regulator of viral defense system
MQFPVMQIPDMIATELAHRQHGAFARWQLLPRGVDPRTIERRIARGYWLALHPGVYALAGTRDTFDRRLWAGWLAVGPDAVASHEAAAQLHRIPNVIRSRVVLTNAHGWHHRLVHVTVHQLDDVLPEHRTGIEGLPVTTPARTVVDLAAVVHPARLLSIVEATHHARIASYSDVGVCVTAIARRGKPGVRRLARVLDKLTATKGVTMSKLERLLLERIADAGLPQPVSQYPFPGRLFTNGCVDAAYVDAKLVIEADGRSWHTRIADVKRDRDRDNDAARHGWQTLRLLHEHITADPTGSAELIRDVRHERLLLLAS